MINKIVIRLQESEDVELYNTKLCSDARILDFIEGNINFLRYKPLWAHDRVDFQLIRQGVDKPITLEISFCPAKVLFRNNLLEVKKEDFKKVLTEIHELLKREGWKISLDTLRNHPITGIDYSKVFASKYNSTQIISLFNQVENHSSLKKAYTVFPNQGCMTAFCYSNRRFMLYDKSKELLQDKSVPDELKNQIRQQKYTFFRWEYNMRTKRAIEQEFRKQKITIPNTFENLFDENIGKQILSFYLSNIMQRMTIVEEDDLLTFFFSMAKDKKFHGPQQSLAFLGYFLGVEKYGRQRLKDLLSASSSLPEVYRTLSNYRKISIPPNTLCKDTIQTLENTLQSMSPIQNSFSVLGINIPSSLCVSVISPIYVHSNTTKPPLQVEEENPVHSEGGVQ